MRSPSVSFALYVVVLLVVGCSSEPETGSTTPPGAEEDAGPSRSGGGAGRGSGGGAGRAAGGGAGGSSGGASGAPGSGGAGGSALPDAAARDDASVTPADAAKDAAASPDAGPRTDGAPVDGAATDAAGADPSAELYDPDRLPRFDLTIPAASMAIIGRSDGCVAGVPRPYVKATLKYGNEMVTDIGVHLKGEASCRPMSKKPAFKLKFDEFVPNQSFRGLRKMTLNNMMEDPTFIAERLSYLVYRSAGLPAPRANSALVYVNGTFYGVYTNIETEDKTFLKRWFASNDGNVYEEQGKDFVPGNENAFQLETNETRNDRSDLKAFIAAIAAAKPATYLADLDATLATQHYLRFTALEALVNQWDMYSYTYYWPNNFRLYGDPTTKKFFFLPWGMDMSMQPREWLKKPERHIPLFDLVKTAGVVFKGCVASPSCKETYKGAVTEMLKVYESLGLGAVATRYYMQVKPSVYMDSRKEWSNADFEKFQMELQRTIREKPAFIRAELMK